MAAWLKQHLCQEESQARSSGVTGGVIDKAQLFVPCKTVQEADVEMLEIDQLGVRRGFVRAFAADLHNPSHQWLQQDNHWYALMLLENVHKVQRHMLAGDFVPEVFNKRESEKLIERRRVGAPTESQLVQQLEHLLLSVKPIADTIMSANSREGLQGYVMHAQGSCFVHRLGQ